MINKKVLLLRATLLISLSAIILVWMLPARKRDFFPAKSDGTLNIRSYTEMRYVTNSAAGRLVQSTDSMVQLDYRQEDERPGRLMKPVTGVEFDLQNDTLSVDRYEYVEILMEMKNVAACNVAIITAEAVDSTARELKSRFTEAVARPNPENDRYRIALADFETPQWWRNAVGRANFIRFVAPEPDFSRITGLRIEKNTEGNRPVGSGTVIVKGISFTARKNIPLRFGTTLCIVFLGIMMLRLSRNDRVGRRNIRPDVPYTKIDIPDAAELLTGRIIEYIGTHFNEDIKVASVSKAVGCRDEQVSGMLERASGMKFNQYLNHIRVTEAKRLLNETKHTIAEIALSVGFNNITNFNRIFRLAAGVAPREYRTRGNGAREP